MQGTAVSGELLGASLAAPIVDTLDRLSADVAQTMTADTVLFSVLHDDRLHSLGAAPDFGKQLRKRQHIPGDTVCQQTVLRGAMLSVEDARTHADLKGLGYVADGSVVGYLGVPFSIAELGVKGAVCSICAAPRAWTPLEQTYLTQVATNVELIVLREMDKVEKRALAQDLDEFDKIICALSTELTEPMCIFDKCGELLFANSKLTQLVSPRFIETFWRTNGPRPEARMRGRLPGAPKTDGQVQCVRVPTVSGEDLSFAVAWSIVASGMIVCRWRAIPTPVA